MRRSGHSVSFIHGLVTNLPISPSACRGTTQAPFLEGAENCMLETVSAASF